MKKIFLTLLAVLPFVANAADHYQSGNISNLTAVESGVMIMIDKGVPTMCEGTRYGWLLIKQENTALTSTVLTSWASGNKRGTVYVKREDGASRCIVTQWDPVN
ncbi:hypothetical protein [Vibrio coralliilyticus]|uniref:hypothetical protein n=1 Tax=Vibrio coralliilyticus TaxID=190893 RepID=UPI00156087E0|nr:hypothetical protein [Vibrio coralliilyticus]NRF30659.1 hypothetical protein [Vibrio coralliilyticus]NRF54215.1 hypothetical protein [Vibrio coralliilyticus]NRG05605.1 hypothetical protein [Vibrio coralliilyticus]